MRPILGLDIGGANLKAAHTDGTARTRPFALWQAPERLPEALRELIAHMPRHEVLAVTMTGELCDCFASKADGVRALLGAVAEVAAVPVRVWTTEARFATLAEAQAQPRIAAAANWLALGYLAGRFMTQDAALLIDTGSTTTDLLYLEAGVPCPRAYTDYGRLQSGELVYTAVRRTPVCAVLGLDVAAEFFATMLDVYLVLGLIEARPDDCATADGRPATRAAAHARLARLRGADVDEFPWEDAVALAGAARTRQLAHVGRALDRVLAGRQAPGAVIVSGSGSIIGRQLVDTHEALRAVPVVALDDKLGSALSEAACAYAVALLANEG